MPALHRTGVDLRRLQQIVSGLTEGVVIVSPEQDIVWANEAGLRMHGVERIPDLGRTVDDYRQRFRLRYRNNHWLDPADYPIERAVAGEAFSEVVVEVVREGEDEARWIHQIRSLVLTDGDDRPDLLVLVIQDVSLRFEAEERFEQTFKANPAPAVICRLSDQRFVKVNAGFLEMTGWERDDVLGHTVYELDVLADVTDPGLAKQRLREGRTIPQMQADLHLPGGGRKLVIVGGQPIDLNEQPCMLFTFADLEPRRRIEGELRESEARSHRMFELAPIGLGVATLDDHRFLQGNAALLDLTGYTADELQQQTAGSLKLWENAAARADIEQAMRQDGGFQARDACLQRKDGARIDVLISTGIFPMHGSDCVLWVVQDIAERRQSERELIGAIETVMRDTNWFSRTIVEKLANLRAPSAQQHVAEVSSLTGRERETLSLMCEGLDDPAIATAMGVSRNTVRNNVARIYGKLGVNRRGAAIIWARERGFPLPSTRRPASR
ncbi:MULTISPECIES: PAS domain S-box protein [unclassified Sphingomonas]|uniref:PAS domain S-box protein n=1 Tax=unclassified Sphingomonas TaxID=196159 RepID=UPI001F5886F3|nr:MULTISPECIES: PAS domain S-box protein [unclassified Sphingomonas]